MTISNYANILNGVIASLDESAVYEQALATVTAAVEEQRSYIDSQVTAAVQEEVTAKVTAAAQEQIAAQVTAAVHENVTDQVIQTATGMDKAYYDSAIEARLIDEETKAVIENAINEQMESKAVKAILTLKDGAPALVDGVTQLRDGTM